MTGADPGLIAAISAALQGSPTGGLAKSLMNPTMPGTATGMPTAPQTGVPQTGVPQMGLLAKMQNFFAPQQQAQQPGAPMNLAAPAAMPQNINSPGMLSGLY